MMYLPMGVLITNDTDWISNMEKSSAPALTETSCGYDALIMCAH